MKNNKFIEIIKNMLHSMGVNLDRNSSESESKPVARDTKYNELFDDLLLKGRLDEAQSMMEHGYKITDKTQKIINQEVLTGISHHYFKIPLDCLKPMVVNKVGDMDTNFGLFLNFVLKNELVEISTLNGFRGLNNSLSDDFLRELKDSENLMGSMVLEGRQTRGVEKKFQAHGAILEKTLVGWKRKDRKLNYFLESCSIFDTVKESDVEDLYLLKGLEQPEFSMPLEKIMSLDKLFALDGRVLRKVEVLCEIFLSRMIEILVEKKSIPASEILKSVLVSKRSECNAAEGIIVILFKKYPLEVLNNINDNELIEFKRVMNSYFKLIDENLNSGDKQKLFKAIEFLEVNKTGVGHSQLLDEFKRNSVIAQRNSLNYIVLAKSLELPELIVDKLGYIKDRLSYLESKDISVEDKQFVKNSEKSIMKILNVYKDLLELGTVIDMGDYLLNPIMQIDSSIKDINDRYQSSQMQNLLHTTKVMRKNS